MHEDTRLTPRERLFKALSGEKPDVLPAVPAYLCLFLADFERAYYIEQYRRRMGSRLHYSIDHAEDTLCRAQAVYQSYGIFKERPDWIEVGRGACRSWAERTRITNRKGILYYEDRLSGVSVPMHQASVPTGDIGLSESKSSTRDVWEAPPLNGKEDVDASLPILTAEELLARGDFDLPRQVVADYGKRYFISTILDTPFSDAYDLLGFQGLMLIQGDQPDLFHHLLQRKLSQTREVMAAWAAAGIHGVYVEEVFTGADMISQRSYDRFVFAYNQPYFSHMRSLGLLPIHYVCGDVVPRLERISQMDVAAVAVEESKKNFQIEIEEVVDRIGDRMVILGNIDAVRFGLHASLEDMAAEVNRQAQIGARAKGFIVSTGSPFPLDTNPRLLDTLVSTAHGLPVDF
jgi:hypothetical protein